MSVYMTEEEQLEAIKKWWKQYGTMVTVVLSLIMLSIAGYRVYNWHQEKIIAQASTTYENMMIAFSNHNNKAVRSYASELIHEYNHTVYADAAHMTLAKLYVAKNKLEPAKAQLQWVADNSKMTALKQVAKIRLARIMAAGKSYTSALDELNQVDDQAYLPVINELKGDIYGATGQYQKAIKAYHLASHQVKTNGMGNLFLEMKTNELAIKTQSVTSEDKKVQTT